MRSLTIFFAFALVLIVSAAQAETTVERLPQQQLGTLQYYVDTLGNSVLYDLPLKASISLTRVDKDINTLGLVIEPSSGPSADLSDLKESYKGYKFTNLNLLSRVARAQVTWPLGVEMQLEIPPSGEIYITGMQIIDDKTALALRQSIKAGQLPDLTIKLRRALPAVEVSKTLLPVGRLCNKARGGLHTETIMEVALAQVYKEAQEYSAKNIGAILNRCLKPSNLRNITSISEMLQWTMLWESLSNSEQLTLRESRAIQVTDESNAPYSVDPEIGQ